MSEEKTTLSGKPPSSDATPGAPGKLDHTTGMFEDYWVLSEAERAKGFVRPVRRSYMHRDGCQSVTTMAQALAETYARNPKFYGSTFCVRCRVHLPVDEFVWDGTNEKVGS